MGNQWGQQADWSVVSDLKEIVRDASRALAHLEGARLEELAIACQALNRDECRNSLAKDGTDREMRSALAVLDRMIEMTRANIYVLHGTGRQRIEYCPGQDRK